MTEKILRNWPGGHCSGFIPCHECGVRWKSRLPFPAGPCAAATFSSSKVGAECVESGLSAARISVSPPHAWLQSLASLKWKMCVARLRAASQWGETEQPPQA